MPSLLQGYTSIFKVLRVFLRPLNIPVRIEQDSSLPLGMTTNKKFVISNEMRDLAELHHYRFVPCPFLT
jgi:hypothetical protein